MSVSSFLNCTCTSGSADPGASAYYAGSGELGASYLLRYRCESRKVFGEAFQFVQVGFTRRIIDQRNVKARSLEAKLIPRPPMSLGTSTASLRVDQDFLKIR